MVDELPLDSCAPDTGRSPSETTLRSPRPSARSIENRAPPHAASEPARWVPVTARQGFAAFGCRLRRP